MTNDLNGMVEDLKKEISDNLTRRISFMPFNVSSENNHEKKVRKDKKKFIIPVLGFVISIFIIILSCLNIIKNNKVIEDKITNDIRVNVSLNDTDFTSNNENTDSYLATLINKVNIDFINNVDDSSYSFDKSVVATVLITDANDDNNIIFKKSENLVNNYKGIYNDKRKNKTKVIIDYSKYNSIINKYKKKIDIVNNSRLEVLYTNKVSKDNKNVVITQKVIIPLSKDMVNIKKEYNNVSYLKENLKINYNYIYILILGILIFISSFIYLIILINKTKDNLSVLEKKYNKIMKDYNSIIIEVEDDSFKEKLAVITVKYFVDLIDAQQELHVPILCYTDLKTGITCFYLVTDKYVYKYILNKSDERL